MGKGSRSDRKLIEEVRNNYPPGQVWFQTYPGGAFVSFSGARRKSRQNAMPVYSRWNFMIIVLQLFSGQQFVALQILVDCLFNNLVGQRPVVSLVCFQPVSCKLFVKRGLGVSGFITFGGPET